MVPPRLYKYQPLTTQTLANLKARTIWFPPPAAFNDPFDCALQVMQTDLSDADFTRMLDYVQKSGRVPPDQVARIHHDGVVTQEAREAFLRIALRAFEDRRKMHTNERGVACFSATPTDLLMWGHYADGHRGICLEFDTRGEPFSEARPVKYSAVVPQINPVDVLESPLPEASDEMMDAMILTKSECWRYEQEWRVLYIKANQAYTYEYSLLTGVYLGATMPAIHRDIVSHLLVGAPTKIHVMELHEKEFGLRIRPIDYMPYVYKQVPPRS